MVVPGHHLGVVDGGIGGVMGGVVRKGIGDHTTSISPGGWWSVPAAVAASSCSVVIGRVVSECTDSTGSPVVSASSRDMVSSPVGAMRARTAVAPAA